MTRIADDFAAIAAAVPELDKAKEPLRHDIELASGGCRACLASYEEIVDNVSPEPCAGKPPEPGTILFEDNHHQIVYLGLNLGGRYVVDKRGDVARQWKDIKRCIASEAQRQADILAMATKKASQTVDDLVEEHAARIFNSDYSKWFGPPGT